MRRAFSILFTAISLIYFSISCSGNLSEVEILEHSIKRNQEIESDTFPFSNDEELKYYINNPKIVNYNLIRKIALLELSETGFLKDLGWKGCKLSQRPITLYNLNSEPRFYDFIVKDPENKVIGTVRTHAQKTESTVIAGTYQKCFDYNSMLTKATTNNPTLFIDWKGEEFVGVKSKAGEAPTNLITKEGRTIANNQVKDLEGEEIIDFFKENLFSNLKTDKNELLKKLPDNLKNNTILDKFTFSENSTGILADSMKVALIKNQNESNNYWNTLNEYEEELLNTKDEDLTSDSKFLGRLFRRIFSSTDESPYCIEYYNYRFNNDFPKAGRWCGPWACGYILYVEQHKDKYDFFESCASSVGELLVLNFALRIFGRPLTPMEMAWSMPIASSGQIWINPAFFFQDFCAYDNIVNYKFPALRLCAVGGGLHWVIAYGAKQTGSWAWRNYYFLQIDNGALIKNELLNTYTKVEWWNPWLMVYL